MSITISDDLARRTQAMLIDFATSAGHLSMRVSQEHRGVCTGRPDCGASCREWGALLEAWTEHVTGQTSPLRECLAEDDVAERRSA